MHNFSVTNDEMSDLFADSGQIFFMANGSFFFAVDYQNTRFSGNTSENFNELADFKCFSGVQNIASKTRNLPNFSGNLAIML